MANDEYDVSVLYYGFVETTLIFPQFLFKGTQYPKQCKPRYLLSLDH